MTDRERAVDVLRNLRDELAHDPAICCIVGNAIDVLHNLPASAIWELEDAADRAMAADLELDCRRCCAAVSGSSDAADQAVFPDGTTPGPAAVTVSGETPADSSRSCSEGGGR